MVHGDLKGVWLRIPVAVLRSDSLFTKPNILIDQDGHARLADFGLLTIISDPSNPTASSSSVKGGTTRWMSPELLDPDRFGSGNGRPTVESDCYALGMVIYEVLSGQVPFASDREPVVTRKVTEGERPRRPPQEEEPMWFTDDIWEILKLCWATKPEMRPSIESVLECLGRVSWSYPGVDDGTVTRTNYERSSTETDSCMFSHFH